MLQGWGEQAMLFNKIKVKIHYSGSFVADVDLKCGHEWTPTGEVNLSFQFNGQLAVDKKV